MAEPKPDFSCKRCGHCCEWEGDVRITVEEAQRIADFTGIKFEAFMTHYTRLAHDRKSLSLAEVEPSKHCVFYDAESRGCRIQKVKPEHCKAFPFEWNFPGWEAHCLGAQNENI